MPSPKKNNLQTWRNLKQHQVIPKKEMKMPEKKIKVVIRKGFSVYTDCESKVEGIRARYAN
jgi:hypothetical protein